MSVTKQLVKGEEGFKEFFNVKKFDSTGARVAKDLTGFTVTIYIYDTATRTTKLVDGGACTVEDAGTGQVSFTVTAASTATVARYLGRLYMVKGAEKSWTKEFNWNVELAPTA